MASKQKVWDLPVRLFHWAVVMLVLLLWITGEFGGADLAVSLPLFGDIYLSNMDIHGLAGQAVLVLVVFRIFWGVWGSTTARFSHFIKAPSVIFTATADLFKGRVNRATGHNPLGGVMVVVLLLLLAGQSVTGLFSADDFFYEGPLTHLVSEDGVETASRLHHLSFSVIQGLVILHIVAIFYYLARGKNLIGAMITGNKKNGPEEQLAFAPGWLAIVSLAAAVALLLFFRSL